MGNGFRIHRRWVVLTVVVAVVLATPWLGLAGSGKIPKEQEVLHSFDQFQQMWMDKLARRGRYGPKFLEVKENEYYKGRYDASYKELGKVERFRIKKTGLKSCPYLGILEYSELVYVHHGKSPAEARQGPFKKESENAVTEIFRYARGKWIY